MNKEAGISVEAAREQIMGRALKGEKTAWDALVNGNLWVYLDGVIEGAAKGDEKALEVLMQDPWMYVILIKIAEWANRKYHFIHDEKGREVPEVLTQTLRLKITNLENSRGTSWRYALRSWCYSTAKNHCLNYLNRGRRDVEKYQDTVTRENTRYKLNRQPVIEPCENMKLRGEIEEEQEQEREQERLKALWKSHAAATRSAVWRLFYSLDSDEQEMVRLWAIYGMTFEEIGVAMDVARATANRKFQPILALFVNELVPMIEELRRTSGRQIPAGKVLGNLTEHRAGNLRKLIAIYLPRPVAPGPAVYAGM